VAHANIASNKGATTKGVDDTTVDGYSDERAIVLMELLKTNRYQPIPVRRTYIPKPNGKKRPLGIPNDPDKLVQEACRLLLEAIYEPVFHEHSYGFRPKRGCHDALKTINRTWNGTKWFIEFDIKGYFDNINHHKMMEILSEKIDDDRFLALIRKMLKAGYMEDWQYNKTYSGTPQGGVISPILANIYLDKLDQYTNDLCHLYTHGKERALSKEYKSLYGKLGSTRFKLNRKGLPFGSSERQEQVEKIQNLQRQIRDTPVGNDFDQSFRRLWYTRYADDFVFGFIGSQKEAEEIMMKVRNYLEDTLHLEVSEDKTKIRHHADGIRFLGYDLRTSRAEYFKKKVVDGRTQYQRYGSKNIKLFVPWEKLRDLCDRKSYGDFNAVTSTHRSHLLQLSDAEIVCSYNAELRGIAQYYKHAADYSKLIWRLHFIADYSCRKTLANKHKSTVSKISKYYVNRLAGGGKRIVVRNGSRTFKLFKPNDVDRTYHRNATENVDSIAEFYAGRNDLTRRRKLEVCEYCGDKTAFVEEHHIRALKDISKGAKRWERMMTSRNRKTLILCIPCHDQLHAGKLPDIRQWNAA
jgi:RNA-directed DNA polymerase